MTQDNDKLLTSHQVGELLQVNPSSINKWVNDGRIQAFRTPGGHRRIRVADLVAFLEKHKMPVPRTLSTMFAAGVPLVEALTSVAGATGNIVYEDATLRIRERHLEVDIDKTIPGDEDPDLERVCRRRLT